jgi:hypothetical protein
MKVGTAIVNKLRLSEKADFHSRLEDIYKNI